MSTKIKGKRIAPHTLTKEHFVEGIKFNEGEDIVLNFPTHDNSSDLSLEQKQILTQKKKYSKY